MHRSFMDEKDRIITAIYNDTRARARSVLALSCPPFPVRAPPPRIPVPTTQVLFLQGQQSQTPAGAAAEAAAAATTRGPAFHCTGSMLSSRNRQVFMEFGSFHCAGSMLSSCNRQVFMEFGFKRNAKPSPAQGTDMLALPRAWFSLPISRRQSGPPAHRDQVLWV